MWSWLLCLCFSVALAEPECSMSMVQTRLHLEPQPNPWEVYDYLTASYHKAGVYLTSEIHVKMFRVLGAPRDAFSFLEYPCYHSYQCKNLAAPIKLFVDGYNASWKAAHPSSKPLRVAGSVRDPLQMVASAYCYHHEGREVNNTLMPVRALMSLGVEEGTALTAKAMLPTIEYMASIFAEPDNNTLRLDYDELTKSSEGFDAAVRRWVSHYFGELITMEQRHEILEAVKVYDENRNPSIDNVSLNPDDPPGTHHGSDPECKQKANEAVFKMERSLLGRYQELQQRLGFPVQTINIDRSSSYQMM